MIRIPAPPQDRRDGVGEAITAKFGLHPHAVVLVGDELQIDCGPGDEAMVRAAVKAHKPAKPQEPVEPLTDGEITQLRDMLAERRGA